MMPPNNDTPEMTPEERNFVKRLAEHYSPPPMTASERVAFDEALQSRLPRRGARMLRPLAVAGAGAVLALMFALFSGIGSDLMGRKATPPQVLRETAKQRERVGNVLFALAFDEPNGFDTDEWLPEDYVGISMLLNDVEG